MKRKMIKSILCLIMLFAVSVIALTGCSDGSKKDSKDSKDSGSSSELTRAEFIGMLGHEFGYEQAFLQESKFNDVTPGSKNFEAIQASAEWGIIDSDSSFKPDDAATLEFSINSAVRAIGIEKIQNAGAPIDEKDLTNFFTGNVAKIDVSDTDSKIDRTTAEQILSLAHEYQNKLTSPQVTNIKFVDGVKMADSNIILNADGRTGVILEEGKYTVGDIVYFDATDHSMARGIKILAIEGKTFSFVDAELEDVFSELNIHGTFKPTVVEAIPASDKSSFGLDRDIYDNMKEYSKSYISGNSAQKMSNSVNIDSGSDHIMVKASFDVTKKDGDTTAKSNGNLVIGIKNFSTDVDLDYKFKWFSIDVKRLTFKLNFDTEISSDIHGSVATSIPLGEVYFNVWGPVNIKVSLTAHVGADGNIEISYTTQNVMTVEWQKSCGIHKDFSSKAQAKCEIDAQLTAKLTLLADLRIGFKKWSFSVANAQVTSGLVGTGKLEADLLGDQPTCLDLQIYVPLSWGVNQQSCLITDISSSLKASGDIWDSTNSPVNLHWHFEDGKKVEACTRTDPVEQELTTPEGEPLIETDPFDFEPLDFDFIELDSYSMYLDKGQSMDIDFESIPDGYSKSDMIYEVEDGSVCSVSNGTVTALESGSTIVKIKTKDDIFSVAFVVVVRYDYSVPEFEELT